MVEPGFADEMIRFARAYAVEKRVSVVVQPIDVADVRASIAEGEPVDVLVTFRVDEITKLRQQGLADIYTDAAIASDSLVLAGPQDVALQWNWEKSMPVTWLINAMHGEAALYVGNPEYIPEGGLVRDALRRVRADADLEPYINYVKTRREMAQAVKRDGGYAIMLASEAKSLRLNVLGTLGPAYAPPIGYRALVIASEHMELGRHFVQYLQRR